MAQLIYDGKEIFKVPSLKEDLHLYYFEMYNSDERKDLIWTSADGRNTRVPELHFSHLVNIINMLRGDKGLSRTNLKVMGWDNWMYALKSELYFRLKQDKTSKEEIIVDHFSID